MEPFGLFNLLQSLTAAAKESAENPPQAPAETPPQDPPKSAEPPAPPPPEPNACVESLAMHEKRAKWAKRK